MLNIYRRITPTVYTSISLPTSQEPDVRKEKPGIQTQDVSEEEQVVTYEMTS